MEPAGMTNSGFFALNDLPSNTANGYLEDRQTTNIYNLPIRGGGDGGMFTTSDDVATFWQSLLAHKLLNPTLLHEFLQTRQSYSTNLGYGCGIYTYLNGSGYAISGSDAGVGFYSGHFPSSSITVTILSNLSDGDTEMKHHILGQIQ